MKPLRFASCLLTATVLAQLAPTESAAQTARYRAELHVRVDALPLDYSSGPAAIGGVILEGEPLIVELSLVNQRIGPPAGAEVDWLARTELKVLTGGQFDKTRTVVVDQFCQGRFTPRDDRRLAIRNNDVILEYGGAQTLRCQVDPAEYRLAPGRYVLAPTWKEEAIASSAFVRSPASDGPHLMEFEIRAVRSETDALDRDLHLARRAFFNDRRPSDAVRFADRVLATDPSSASALILRGDARRALGQCADAKADWRRAAAALSTEAGTRARLSAVTPEQRQRVREEWERRATEMTCP